MTKCDNMAIVSVQYILKMTTGVVLRLIIYSISIITISAYMSNVALS